jgi:hypothetical protein
MITRMAWEVKCSNMSGLLPPLLLGLWMSQRDPAVERQGFLGLCENFTLHLKLFVLS